MLISNDAELRQFIPNVFTSCDGEVPLLEKLTPFLTLSEAWLTTHFVGSAFLASAVAVSTSTLRSTCCNIVVADAFRSALPSLDLVLTPNGFGIVSNGNLAPASAERVNRLADSLINLRDNLLQSLLLSLSQNATWRDSEQGRFFAATLWQDLSLATACGITCERWKHFQELRNQLILIEDELAERFISHELFSTFRQHVQSSAVSEGEQPIIAILRSVETQLLMHKCWENPAVWRGVHEQLLSLVQRIRSNPTAFPQWQSSTTAQRYNLPQFVNEKHSKGYWW